MSGDKPNNFPRDGRHRPITRDHIERLKQDLAQPKRELDYTYGGFGETSVHTTLDSAKRNAIRVGEQRLNEASKKLDYDHSFAALAGKSRADLNKAVQAREAAGKPPPDKSSKDVQRPVDRDHER